MYTVLIIDDDRIITSIYQTKLRLEGFAAESASDGPQALEVARRVKPSAILLDLMLPGMSGIEVLKEIRADAVIGQTPVIVLSNTHMQGVIGEAWSSGADSVLPKSGITPNEVIEGIRRILDARAAAAADAARPKPPAAAGDGAGSADALEALWQRFLASVPGGSALPGHLPAGRGAEASDPRARVRRSLELVLAEIVPDASLITPTILRTVSHAAAVLAREAVPFEPRARPWLALVLHRDAQIRSGLRLGLEAAGFAVVVVSTADVAFGLLHDNAFDVILPEAAGMAVVRAGIGKSPHGPAATIELIAGDAGSRQSPRSTPSGEASIAVPCTSAELALAVWTALAARQSPREAG